MTAAGSQGKERYVSTSGADSGQGSREAPFRTIQRALKAARPGDVIHVQAGEYPGNVAIDGPVSAGRADAPIRLVGEGRVRIVPGKQGGTLIQVRRPYWRIENLEVDARGQKRFAAAFERDTQGSALVGSHLYGGTMGAGVSTALGARGVLIEGNHIHDFRKAGGGDSHGVVVQATSRDIVIRKNDIHSTSGDAVQCLKPDHGQAPAQGVRIENNHLHATHENAVDIKTCRDVVVSGNRMHGFRKSGSSAGEAVVVHYSASNVRVENNDISDAGRGVSVGGVKEGPDPSNIVVKNNRIRAITKAGGSDGAGIRVENARDVKLQGNTVEDTAGYGMMLGLGANKAPSKDLVVEGNTVHANNLVRIGKDKDRPGLTMDHNHYASQGRFKAENKETQSFNDWKRMSGVDKASTQK